MNDIELIEFYGSIGRRCKVKDPYRHWNLTLEGEFEINGYEVERIPSGAMQYKYKLKRPGEFACGYCVNANRVELI